ncbi:MAG: flagellar basal body P-ring formation chaperone FlgA [Phycisphaerales bacterium]
MNEWRGRFRRLLGGALMTAVFIATAGYADEIVLKGSVRLRDDDHVVRLGHIAELTGPFAERLADTPIAEAPEGNEVLELSVREVRHTLDEAGAHWGKVQLNGRRVVVRPHYAGNAHPPLAMAATSIDKAPRQDPRRPAAAAAAAYEYAADLVDRYTLRGNIAAIVARGLGVEPSELRLAFDRRDVELLNTSLDAFRFEIQPLSSLHSDRIELLVRAWSAGRIHHKQSLTVRPSLHLDAVVLRRDVPRGTMLHDDDLAIEARWLPPTAAVRLATFVEAGGRVASGRLRSGNVLRKSDIARQFVIKRGDRVMVRCIVGGVVISLEAEARGHGAEGDTIELRKLGERETFIATVTGPHAAVMDLNHL